MVLIGYAEIEGREKALPKFGGVRRKLWRVLQRWHWRQAEGHCTDTEALCNIRLTHWAKADGLMSGIEQGAGGAWERWLLPLHLPFYVQHQRIGQACLSRCFHPCLLSWRTFMAATPWPLGERSLYDVAHFPSIVTWVRQLNHQMLLSLISEAAMPNPWMEGVHRLLCI